MHSTTRTAGRTLWVAARAIVLFTIVLGIGYTLLITGIGQLAFPDQANGSLLRDHNGGVVGSALIGQPYLDSSGAPLPQFFQPRPSAAGDGYAGDNSSGSNYGPENQNLIAAIAERKLEVARFNGVTPGEVPADAVTASGSGLDPHISPEYALLQVRRVANARGLTVGAVGELVHSLVRPPDFGYLGESTVNVLQLNLALQGLGG